MNQLEEAEAQVQTIFAQHSEFVDQEAERVRDLEAFLEDVQNNTQLFDADDVKRVTDALETRRYAVNAAQEEMAARQAMYEQTVSRIKQTVAGRQNLLDQWDRETTVFQQNPDLTAYLVDKQVTLVETLGICINKLKQPLASITPVESGTSTAGTQPHEEVIVDVGDDVVNNAPTDTVQAAS